MTNTLRFSANINTFNACADRYVLSGYGERLTTDQLIRAATQVEGLIGVEVVGLWHVNDSNVETIRQQIRNAGLEVTCVGRVHHGHPPIQGSRTMLGSKRPTRMRQVGHLILGQMGWARSSPAGLACASGQALRPRSGC